MDDPKEAALIPFSDPCPQGCGNLTDDPYGGPCTDCWNAIYDAKGGGGDA